jgi:uncharacterized protein
MALGTVVEVWRYPVKSLGGERLDEPVGVSAAGIEGDRCLAVVDPATEKVLSAKTVPVLLQASARWEDGTIRITSPAGGLDVRAADDDVHDRLSAWLGRPVRLEAPVPGHRAPFDLELDPDDPSEVTELRTPPGSFFDSRSTLHLLTTASLGGHDVRRFRPNLLVDAGAGDHPEDDWVGRQLRLGGDEGVSASVRKRTSRCVLVTKPQPGLPQDSAVFRDLVRDRAGDLGIYVDPQPAERGRIGPGATIVG